MTLDEKFELAMSVAEECVQPEELRNLLEKKPNPVAYDGFEPSGRMHIAQVHHAGRKCITTLDACPAQLLLCA